MNDSILDKTEGILGKKDFLYLILSNLVIILFAIYFNWNLSVLLFYYFVEIVLLGVIALLKLILSNIKEYNKYTVLWIILFVLQYSIFCLIYLSLITNFGGFKIEYLNGKWESFALSTLILIYSSYSSIIRFRKRNRSLKKDSLVKIFFSPYKKRLLSYLSLIFVIWFFSSTNSSYPTQEYENMFKIIFIVLIKVSFEILSLFIISIFSGIKRSPLSNKVQ